MSFVHDESCIISHLITTLYTHTHTHTQTLMTDHTFWWCKGLSSA